MWIDTHAHLHDLTSNQLIKVINEATDSSVGLIISTATNIETSRKVIEHVSLSPVLFGAIGISPFDIENQNENWSFQLKSILNNKRIIAIGEIGIDSSNPRYPSLEKQLPFFETQLTIAKESNIPAIIHSRGAEDLTFSICKNIGMQNVIFHCFTGNYQIAKRIIDNEYFLSFSGIITFKNAAIRSMIPELPLEQLLIETDSPYLAPVPFRGKPNKPSYVSLIGEEIAHLRNIDPKDLQMILEKNFHRCFKIDK